VAADMPLYGDHVRHRILCNTWVRCSGARGPADQLRLSATLSGTDDFLTRDLTAATGEPARCKPLLVCIQLARRSCPYKATRRG
jgi:hypothetical protein